MGQKPENYSEGRRAIFEGLLLVRFIRPYVYLECGHKLFGVSSMAMWLTNL